MIGSPIAVLKKNTYRQGLEGGLLSRTIVLDGGRTTDIEMVKGAMRLEYGVIDAIDVFVKVGIVGDDFRLNDYPTKGSDINFISETAISYGAGVKATFYEFKQSLLGAGIQLEEFTLVGLNSVDGADARLDWTSYRAFAGLHLDKVPYFVPYGGVYFDLLDAELETVGTSTAGVDTKTDIGLFYGADIPISLVENLLFTVELRLLAENAFSFSFRYAH